MDAKLSLDENLLDPGLLLRPVKWSDLEAVARLIYDVCAADGDTSVALTPDELKHEWRSPGFTPERDAFVVETGDGRIAGYEELTNGHEHAIRRRAARGGRRP